MATYGDCIIESRRKSKAVVEWRVVKADGEVLLDWTRSHRAARAMYRATTGVPV
jgi:hypothetical protein